MCDNGYVNGLSALTVWFIKPIISFEIYFARLVEFSSAQKACSTYRKVSNTSCTLVRNKIVDHADEVGAARGFNGLGKDNCKTRRETFMFGDWVRLILENWRYILWFPLQFYITDALCCMYASVKRAPGHDMNQRIIISALFQTRWQKW